MDGSDHSASPRPGRTTPDPSKRLGWAEITHPFHPRRGQRFLVLKVRRLSGVESLILGNPEEGTLCVPREWTDLADASPYSALGIKALILDFEHLVTLADVVEQIGRAGAGEVEP